MRRRFEAPQGSPSRWTAALVLAALPAHSWASPATPGPEPLLPDPDITMATGELHNGRESNATELNLTGTRLLDVGKRTLDGKSPLDAALGKALIDEIAIAKVSSLNERWTSGSPSDEWAKVGIAVHMIDMDGIDITTPGGGLMGWGGHFIGGGHLNLTDPLAHVWTPDPNVSAGDRMSVSIINRRHPNVYRVNIDNYGRDWPGLLLKPSYAFAKRTLCMGYRDLATIEDAYNCGIQDVTERHSPLKKDCIPGCLDATESFSDLLKDEVPNTGAEGYLAKILKFTGGYDLENVIRQKRVNIEYLKHHGVRPQFACDRDGVMQKQSVEVGCFRQSSDKFNATQIAEIELLTGTGVGARAWPSEDDPEGFIPARDNGECCTMWHLNEFNDKLRESKLSPASTPAFSSGLKEAMMQQDLLTPWGPCKIDVDDTLSPSVPSCLFNLFSYVCTCALPLTRVLPSAPLFRSARLSTAQSIRDCFTTRHATITCPMLLTRLPLVCACACRTRSWSTNGSSRGTMTSTNSSMA